MNDYEELEKELAYICLMCEVDSSDIALYAERIAKLEAAGGLSAAQMNTLRDCVEELTINWIPGDE